MFFYGTFNNKMLFLKVKCKIIYIIKSIEKKFLFSTILELLLKMLC